MLFGPKKILCRAGHWTTIIETRFRQMPAYWTVVLEAPAEGEVEEEKSKWIVPAEPVRRPIQRRMDFDRGIWNTFYRVRIRPDRDVMVAFE